jgi:hypothetical protein
MKSRQLCRHFGETSSPSYSTFYPIHPIALDLAPSDFHLFGVLKNVVHGVMFTADDNVISAVETWLHEQDKEWYQQGLHTLISCWLSAVEIDGDFVEKYCLETILFT